MCVRDDEQIIAIGIGHLSLGLCRILTRYGMGYRVDFADSEVIDAGERLLAQMLAGSMYLSTERRREILPQGEVLADVVRKYSYARKVWTNSAFVYAIPNTPSTIVDRIEVYLNFLQNTIRIGPLEREADTPDVLNEISIFFSILNSIMSGIVNSYYRLCGIQSA